MSNYRLSEIFIYPIKSLGGISVKEAEVTDRGLKHDRRWMLIDEYNNFITQRAHPQLSLLQVTVEDDQISIYHKHDSNKSLIIPIKQNQFSDNLTEAFVWDDKVQVQIYNDRVNEWFSKQAGLKCKLVYMPDSTERKVDSTFAKKGEVTSLSDGYPFLIIGQESLNLLNRKLEKSIPMNRFRPNLVFEGGDAHEEDKWSKFNIGDITFFGVKLCSRCVVTTIDQKTAAKNQEPLKTLSTYRETNGKILFGMNLLSEGKGILKVGQLINV